MRCWSKSRRVPPSGPRLRRPVKERPRSRPCIYSPTGRVGLRTGVSDSPSMAQRKRPAVLAGPATRPFPFESLACGYRPRGWHPPALSTTEVACGESEELGFASWVGTLACLVCMASVALGTSRVRARACAPTPPQTADHALDMPQPALHLRPTYPWRRSPRCGRKANKAATPYPARLRPLA